MPYLWCRCATGCKGMYDISGAPGTGDWFVADAVRANAIGSLEIQQPRGFVGHPNLPLLTTPFPVVQMCCSIGEGHHLLSEI